MTRKYASYPIKICRRGFHLKHRVCDPDSHHKTQGGCQVVLLSQTVLASRMCLYKHAFLLILDLVGHTFLMKHFHSQPMNMHTFWGTGGCSCDIHRLWLNILYQCICTSPDEWPLKVLEEVLWWLVWNRPQLESSHTFVGKEVQCWHKWHYARYILGNVISAWLGSMLLRVEEDFLPVLVFCEQPPVCFWNTIKVCLWNIQFTNIFRKNSQSDQRAKLWYKVVQMHWMFHHSNPVIPSSMTVFLFLKISCLPQRGHEMQVMQRTCLVPLMWKLTSV